jgi:hypothetical protein
MARIEGVPTHRAGLLARTVFRMSRRMLGKVPEPLTIAAHHGEIFRATVGYEFFLARARRVPAKVKALVSIKAAALIGCPF